MKNFKRGDFLVREGEPSRSIFILVQGRVGVFKGKLKVSEFAEKGMIFGEMSAILGEKRTASLCAIEDSLVIDFDKGIDFLINEHPDIIKRLLSSLAERLKKTTQDYWMFATEMSAKQLEQVVSKDALTKNS
ncbi:MAG: Crp/Fnr family transcriptional regulator [Ignavibacteriales bacterium]|nr:Crp/Fnr family transcriptional regulator [Ignavibacteriales bacterium]